MGASIDTSWGTCTNCGRKSWNMYLLGGWCGNCRSIGKPKEYEMPWTGGPLPELYFRITDSNDCGSSRVVTEMTKPLSREHARQLVRFVYDLAAPKRGPKKKSTRSKRRTP